MKDEASRPTFSTGWGLVLATAGLAIGLGNIWRFPYMMGKYGGCVFLLIYVALVIAFGVPGLMVECALGRHTRRGPMGAYAAVSMPGGRVIGGLLVLTVLMAASYYGIVLAWVLFCATSFAIAGALGSEPASFAAFRESFSGQMVLVFVTAGLGCLAVAAGVRRGIQRLSTWGLPIFFGLFVILIVRVLSLDGAMEGLRAFLRPRPADLSGATVLAAMGQAFFSLGLGGTFMVVYGSYMRREDSIPRTAFATAAADLAAALMAGLIVVPAVLALGLDLDTGYSLLFEVMPAVFGQMPAGNLFGAVFFFSVFLVGLLSLIAAYEVLVAAAADSLGWRRWRSARLILALQLALAVPGLFIGSYIKYSDLIWGTTMQPLGSALAVVALAWCVGRARALQEIARSGDLAVPRFFFYWIKYVMPLGIAAMLIYGWLSW